MPKLIAGNDRAIAVYARSHNWTPLGGGRYTDEHGGAVRRLIQPEGLLGMTPTNAKLLAVMPDDQGTPRPTSQMVRAILAEAQRGQVEKSRKSRSHPATCS